MKTIQSTFGDRVKALREHYGKSQSQFAYLIGLKSYQGISKIENGQTEQPQGDTIEKIVSVFGTTREWLIHGKGEMLPGGMVELKQEVDSAAGPWKDEAYQEVKKQNDRLANQVEFFQKQIEFFQGIIQSAGLNFLKPVRKTG
jgi:transcriptional regulator with XRE-family HTH domain